MTAKDTHKSKEVTKQNISKKYGGMTSSKSNSNITSFYTNRSYTNNNNNVISQNYTHSTSVMQPLEAEKKNYQTRTTLTQGMYSYKNNKIETVNNNRGFENLTYKRNQSSGTLLKDNTIKRYTRIVN